MWKSTAPKKAGKPIRADRNGAEADVEERSIPYEEIGMPEEEIRRQRGTARQEPGPNPGPVPGDGS